MSQAIETPSFTNLPAEQINKLRDAFQLIDQDNDGEISAKDLKQIYQSMGQDVAAERIKEMLSTKMTFTAFLSLMSNGLGQIPNKNEIVRALKIFSQDMEINAKELKESLITAGMDNEELDPIFDAFKSVRMNGDQVFMGKEFLNFVSS